MKDESGSPSGFNWDRNIRLKDFVMWWEGRLRELDGQTQRARAELSAVTENIEKAREELVKVRNDVIATRELFRGEPDDQLRKVIMAIVAGDDGRMGAVGYESHSRRCGRFL